MAAPRRAQVRSYKVRLLYKKIKKIILSQMSHRNRADGNILLHFRCVCVLRAAHVSLNTCQTSLLQLSLTLHWAHLSNKISSHFGMKTVVYRYFKNNFCISKLIMMIMITEIFIRLPCGKKTNRKKETVMADCTLAILFLLIPFYWRVRNR